MKTDDLDLVPEDALIDAIGRRYGCFVFVGAKNKQVVGGNQIVTMRVNYDGDRLRALGLCHFMAARIAIELVEEMREQEA